MKINQGHVTVTTASALVVLIIGLVLVVGCDAPAPEATPNPLVDFHPSSRKNLDSNTAITADYKDYIRTLSPEERMSAGPIWFSDGPNGEHAVTIEIGINGTEWEHVLIYDKSDKRIKSVKFATGHYRS